MMAAHLPPLIITLIMHSSISEGSVMEIEKMNKDAIQRYYRESGGWGGGSVEERQRDSKCSMAKVNGYYLNMNQIFKD